MVLLYMRLTVLAILYIFSPFTPFILCILVNYIQFNASNTSDVLIFVKKKSRANCPKTLILRHFLLIFILKTCLTSLFFATFLHIFLLKTSLSFNFFYDINPVFADMCYHRASCSVRISSCYSFDNLFMKTHRCLCQAFTRHLGCQSY